MDGSIASASARRSRIGIKQLEKMVEFMRRHPAFATGQLQGVQGKQRQKLLTQQLADKLNACVDGPRKDPSKWLKTWQDWRCRVKTKAGQIAMDSPTTTKLNSMESICYEIIKKEAATENDVLPEVRMVDPDDDPLQEHEELKPQISLTSAENVSHHGTVAAKVVTRNKMTMTKGTKRRCAFAQDTHACKRAAGEFRKETVEEDGGWRKCLEEERLVIERERLAVEKTRLGLDEKRHILEEKRHILEEKGHILDGDRCRALATAVQSLAKLAVAIERYLDML